MQAVIGLDVSKRYTSGTHGLRRPAAVVFTGCAGTGKSNLYLGGAFDRFFKGTRHCDNNDLATIAIKSEGKCLGQAVEMASYEAIILPHITN